MFSIIFLVIPLSYKHCYNVRDTQNVIFFKDSENIVAKSCFFWCWSRFICSIITYFLSGQVVKTGPSKLQHLPSVEYFKKFIFSCFVPWRCSYFVPFIHLHLSNQELETHKRVVTVVISIWVFSAFISLLVLWSSSATQNLVLLVIAATGFIVSFVVCTRIYLTVRRHKKQIQSMQIQEIVQAGEKANFTALIKSTVGLFYVYLVFLISYLPFFICIAVVRIYGSSIAFRKVFIFSWTLIFLNSSLNPVIYCWKMRHIRRVIIEILGNLSWSRSKPSRLHYNRSSRVVHVENWTLFL